MLLTLQRWWRKKDIVPLSILLPEHWETIVTFFCWGSDALISFECISPPTNCRIWYGSNTDLFFLIRKPKVGEQVSKCSMLLLAPSILMLLLKISSRNIINLTFNFCMTEIRNFISFVNNLGAGLDKRKGILNIYHTFIHHKTIPFDDENSPWISESVKQLAEKNKIFKNFAKLKFTGIGNSLSHLETFNKRQKHVHFLSRWIKAKILHWNC